MPRLALHTEVERRSRGRVWPAGTAGAMAVENGGAGRAVTLLGGLELDGIEPEARYGRPGGSASGTRRGTPSHQASSWPRCPTGRAGGDAAGEHLAGDADGGGGARGHRCTKGVLGTLELLQGGVRWPRRGWAEARLVLVTCGAVAVGAGRRCQIRRWPRLVVLVRSALSEHPGRILLVNCDAAADGCPWLWCVG